MKSDSTQPVILTTSLPAEIIQDHYAAISKLSNKHPSSISNAFFSEHALISAEINNLYQKLYQYLYRVNYLDYSDLPTELNYITDLEALGKQLEKPLLTIELTKANKAILLDTIYLNENSNDNQEVEKFIKIFNELLINNYRDLISLDTDPVKSILKLPLGLQALLLTCFRKLYGDISTLVHDYPELNSPKCFKKHIQLSAWEQDLLIYLNYIRGYAPESKKELPFFSITQIIEVLAYPHIGLHALPFIAHSLEKSLQNQLDHNPTSETQRVLYEKFILLDHLVETKDNSKILDWFSELTSDQINYLNVWLAQASKISVQLPKNYQQFKYILIRKDIDFNNLHEISFLKNIINQFQHAYIKLATNTEFFNHKDIKLYQKLLISTKKLRKYKLNLQLKLDYHNEVINLIDRNKPHHGPIHQDITRINTAQRQELEKFFNNKNLTPNEQEFIDNITAKVPDTPRQKPNSKKPINNNRLLEIAKWLEKYADHPQIEANQYQDMLKIFLQGIKNDSKFERLVELLFISLLNKKSHCHINIFIKIFPELSDNFKKILLDNWKYYFLHAIKTGDINLLEILEELDPQQTQLAIWLAFHSRKELINALKSGNSHHLKFLPPHLHSTISILDSIFKNINHKFYHNNGSEMEQYLLSKWDDIANLVDSYDHPALAILYEIDPTKFEQKYIDIIDLPKPIGVKTLIQLLDYDIPNCIVEAAQSCDNSIKWLLNHLNNEPDCYRASYLHEYTYHYIDAKTGSRKETTRKLLEFRPTDLLSQPNYKTVKRLTTPEIKQFEKIYYQLQDLSRWCTQQNSSYIQSEYIDYKKMLIKIDVLWETLNYYKDLDQKFINHVKIWLSNNTQYSSPNYKYTLNWFIKNTQQKDSEIFIQKLFLNFLIENQIELVVIILGGSYESDLDKLEIPHKFQLSLNENWEFLFENALINENLILLSLLKRSSPEKLNRILNTGTVLQRAARVYPKALEWLLEECPNRSEIISQHKLIEAALHAGNGNTLYILGQILDTTTLSILLNQLNVDKTLQTTSIIANIWDHLDIQRRQMVIDHFNQQQRQQIGLSTNPDEAYSILSVELENLSNIPLNLHNPNTEELKMAIQSFHQACIAYYKNNQLLRKNSQIYKIIKEMQKMLICLNNPDNGEISKQKTLENFIANSQLHINSTPYLIARSMLQVAVWVTIFIGTTALITAASLLISTPISLAIVYIVAYESLYSQLILGTLTMAGLITCTSKFSLPYTHKKTELILQKMDNIESSAGPKQQLLQEKIENICTCSQAFFQSPKTTVTHKDPMTLLEPQKISSASPITLEPEEHQAFWFQD